MIQYDLESMCDGQSINSLVFMPSSKSEYATIKKNIKKYYSQV